MCLISQKLLELFTKITGKGLCAEIVKTMLKLGFDIPGLCRIKAENSGSYRIMELIGLDVKLILLRRKTGQRS